MYLAAELAIVVALFVFGCWGRGAALFLPMIAAALAAFAILVGNPIGLLPSIGGWIILDLTLALAAIIAQAAGHYRRGRHID